MKRKTLHTYYASTYDEVFKRINEAREKYGDNIDSDIKRMGVGYLIVIMQ